MKYEVTTTPSPEDVQALLDGLNEHNLDHVERQEKEIGIFVREMSRVVAGAYCNCFWDWLYLKYLWVAKELRGQDYGKKLMQMVEAEAARRGCLGVHLDTFSFQAIEFYEKLGYEVFGRIDDHPKGHRRYYLKKLLQNTTPEEK